MVDTVKLSRNDWMLFNQLKESIEEFNQTLKETNKILKKATEE